jgi:dTDP-glucose pyrophosphorylase/CBS domain-containing protein
MSRRNVAEFCVSPESTIRDVVSSIDRSGCVSIALVVTPERQLLTTITDGDVRRGILRGVSLDAPVTELFPIKAHLPRPEPVTAPVGTSAELLLELMRERSVRQVPLLDTEGRVVDVAILSDLLPPTPPVNIEALIMAGGTGTRLRPLTEDLPKPMLLVDGKPVLEHVVDQLRKSGIQNIRVATHYKSEQIVSHFGDGHAFDVALRYLKEEQPLGTGGALGLLDAPAGPLLVVNGDVLTNVDYRSMLTYHQDQHAAMTVGVRHYVLQVPYGVIECEGDRVRRFSEKPERAFLVNAGIYLLEPAVFEFIPSGRRFDMTDLIQWLLDAGRDVVSFPIMEYWLDIGRHQDYAQTQVDAGGRRWNDAKQISRKKRSS